MPLDIIRGDITKICCDAIVNAANPTLLGGGGVDGAIHAAAGKELLEECKTLGGCGTGQAKLTKGYKLPAKFVIHTVGPVWHGGGSGEEELLRSCYRNCLAIAAENSCKSIAFPLVSAGVYGYPKAAAFDIAVGEIGKFLKENDMTVYIVVYDKARLCLSELFPELCGYLDSEYELYEKELSALKKLEDAMPPTACFEAEEGTPYGFENELNNLDESFSEMLLRKIDEKGIKDSECYKRANVDRKLFSKIRGDVHYRPKKTTAIAFAIALELPLEETEELLRKAGYALSHSSRFDVIVEYFIKNGNYDVFAINEALFAFDEALIGV